MLARLLLQSTLSLLLSGGVTLLMGTRLRRASAALSWGWLVAVTALSAVGAWWAFGRPLEAAALSLAALLAGGWAIRRLPDWNALGQATWTCSVLTTLLYLTYSLAVTLLTPLHAVGFVLSIALVGIEGLALGLSLTYAFETLDVCTRWRWRRRFGPGQPVPGLAPKVSLHLPAYNEPPEVVAATLRSLAKLDYPNFEVLLVDNNTPDEATWRPLERLCRELGPQFKCLHLHNWPGYKSGALNFSLTQTAPDAEIIGIIDADYQVVPEFLRQTVPYFADPQVAFLQTPQDYRDYAGDTFLEASHYAYKYFFEISMPARNERNAIIIGGTMGLIRKSALQAAGGWDEWCITEDAELSLRLLKQGWQSVYINQTYGRGLMPLNFDGLKKQRFRWCFGGIQILRKHWEALMPWARRVDPSNRLTPAQQYFYAVGGLQWYNEVLSLLFTTFVLLGGLGRLAGFGAGVRPLAGAVVVVPVVLLALGVWRFLWALRHALGLGWGQGLLALGNFFSLGWTVTLGAVQGLIQPRGVFLRTPKASSRSGLLRALRVAEWELTLGAACALVGAGLAVRLPDLAAWGLAALLLWQAGLYLAAPAFSLLSVRREQPLRLISRGDIQGRFLPEARAARWSVALLLLVLFGFGLLRVLPEPATAPGYASLLPTDFAPDELVGEVDLAIPGLAPSATPPPTRESASTATPRATPPRAVPTASFLASSVPSTLPAPATTRPTSAPAPSATMGAAPSPGTPDNSSPLPTSTTTSDVLLSPVPSPTATQRPPPTAPATPPPLPSQVPTGIGPPSQVPTALPTPIPSDVPTNPAPTVVPTQVTPPVPTPPPQPTAPRRR